MINDATAIAQAEGLYRQACLRLKVKPREVSGEIANVSGARVVVLYDAHGKMAGAYQVGDDRVADLDGAELVRLRSRLTHRKNR